MGGGGGGGGGGGSGLSVVQSRLGLAKRNPIQSAMLVVGRICICYVIQYICFREKTRKVGGGRFRTRRGFLVPFLILKKKKKKGKSIVYIRGNNSSKG